MDSNEKEFLMFYMEQTWEEMRHIENLRERTTILVVTISSAIIGFIMQQKFAIETKPLIWFVIALGIFGLIMTIKLYQIHNMDQKRLDKWYIYFEDSCGENPQVLKLRSQADKENKKTFIFFQYLKHVYFWSTIHIFIAIIGIYLLFVFKDQNTPKMKKQNLTEHLKK